MVIIMKKKLDCAKIDEYLKDESMASKDYAGYKTRTFNRMSKDEHRHYKNIRKMGCKKECNPELCKKIK